MRFDLEPAVYSKNNRATTFDAAGEEICHGCGTRYDVRYGIAGSAERVDFSFCESCSLWTCVRCYNGGNFTLRICVYCMDLG